VHQHSAAEKLPELVDDKWRESGAVGLRIDRSDEFREVPAHDAVQYAARRGSRDVDARHATPP